MACQYNYIKKSASSLPKQKKALLLVDLAFFLILWKIAINWSENGISLGDMSTWPRYLVSVLSGKLFDTHGAFWNSQEFQWNSRGIS